MEPGAFTQLAATKAFLIVSARSLLITGFMINSLTPYDLAVSPEILSLNPVQSTTGRLASEEKQRLPFNPRECLINRERMFCEIGYHYPDLIANFTVSRNWQVGPAPINILTSLVYCGAIKVSARG